MPELARPSKTALPLLVFNPPNPSSFFGQRPPAFLPDTAPAAGILGMGNIAEVLGQIPGAVIAGDAAGRAMGRQEAVASLMDKKLASGDLTGVTFDSTGKATYADPTARSSRVDSRGDLYNFLQGQHMNGAPTLPTVPSTDLAVPLSGGVVAPAEPTLPENGEQSFIPLGAAPAGEPLGKVTSYGYSSDPYGDSASLGTGKWKHPTGAWDNKLRETSLAVSPDVERQFKAAGIKEGDPVKLRLADGSEVIRHWDDRTMQDEQAKAKFGKPLTGRFDFYTPGGAPANDGVAVVGFEPAKTSASASVNPAKREQIGNAAEDIGRQLVGNELAGLQAANAPGPTASADLAPSNGQRKVADRVARVTVGKDPRTGAMIYAPTPTDVVAVMPTGDKFNISPPAVAAGAAPKGQAFKTIEEIKAAGINPKGAKLQPDGTYLVEEYQPLAETDRGVAKLTQTQQAQLTSASKLATTIDSVMSEYDALAKEGDAGVIGGRIAGIKDRIGISDEKSSETQAKLNRMLFGIAKDLNGAGVLTEQDMKRAEGSAPNITMGRPQFQGKVNAVKQDLLVGLKTQLAANEGKYTPEQTLLAQEAIASLERSLGVAPSAAVAPGTPPAGAATPASAAAQPVDKVTAAKAQLSGKPVRPPGSEEILNDYKAGKFDNHPKKSEIEKRLRELGLLSGGGSPLNVTAGIQG